MIGGNAFAMPMGRIVLVRKDSQYGAIKFTETWEGETDFDSFTKYESYYQGDGSGDFSKDNVQLNKALLAQRRYIPLIPIFPRPGHIQPALKTHRLNVDQSNWPGLAGVRYILMIVRGNLVITVLNLLLPNGRIFLR